MPLLKIPESLRQRFILDPVAATRDAACITQGSINPFLSRRDAINAAFNRTRLNPFDDNTMMFDKDFKPQRGVNYYMHVDLGTHHDKTGISMAHVEGYKKIIRTNPNGEVINSDMEFPLIQFDFVGSISAQDIGEQVMISDIRDLIIHELINRGFHLRLITFDRYQSLHIMQDLRAEGFVVAPLSLDRTTSKILVDYSKQDNFNKKSTEGRYLSAWESLRDTMYEERLDVPYHTEFMKQCKRAEEDRSTSKTRIKSNVDYYSLDMLESIAGTIFNIVNNERKGFLAPIENDARYQAAEKKEEEFYDDLGFSLYNKHRDYELEDIYKEDREQIV